MNTQYTKEPWKHVYGHDTHKVKRDAKGRMLGSVTMSLEDYDRAIACVNACAGISTESLEHGYIAETREMSEMCARQANQLRSSVARLRGVLEIAEVTIKRLAKTDSANGTLDIICAALGVNHD